MIKISDAKVYNFDDAIYGMRSPHRSWDKIDSYFNGVDYVIGPNDLGLMQRLYKAGPEHRKFGRQIFVSFREITAPLYWWKEMETYKIGVDSDSTSTMHSIQYKEFDFDDFSCEHLNERSYIKLANTIKELNFNRKMYLETGDIEYWWQMIQLLPTPYNQMRTITMNYEVVFNIIHQRTGHRLDEWKVMVDTLKHLPYVRQIMEVE